MEKLAHWEPREESVYSSDFGELPMYGADCSKIICDWVNAALDLYDAERDRLATECEELRAEISDYKDALFHSRASEELAIAFRQESDAQLDALREAVPEGVDSREYDAQHLRSTIWHILYPAPPKESFRDKAIRHGFAPMPPEMGQQTLDGETNYVALPPETNHDAR